MTTMTQDWTPSPDQIKFVESLFKRKFTDTPQARQFWDNLKRCSSNGSLTTFINTMKAMPDVGVLPAAPARPAAPVLPALIFATEAGLYRNPEDGTLYRLSVSEPKNSWGRPVKRISVYSNKAVYRRLTPEGRMVKKGKWTALKSYDRDLMLSYTWRERKGYEKLSVKLLADWLLSDEEKLEWAVGFCMVCSKGLIDAVSVFNQIGPVCAGRNGVELQMPPEDFVVQVEG